MHTSHTPLTRYLSHLPPSACIGLHIAAALLVYSPHIKQVLSSHTPHTSHMHPYHALSCTLLTKLRSLVVQKLVFYHLWVHSMGAQLVSTIHLWSSCIHEAILTSNSVSTWYISTLSVLHSACYLWCVLHDVIFLPTRYTSMNLIIWLYTCSFK